MIPPTTHQNSLSFLKIQFDEDFESLISKTFTEALSKGWQDQSLK